MSSDQDTLLIVVTCLVTGYVTARLIGRRTWIWPLAVGLGALFTLWWLIGEGHGFHVMAVGGVATVALGLRRGFRARRLEEARMEREMAVAGHLRPPGLWAWIWHGAGLTAAFASFWILIAIVFLDGSGFDGPRMMIFGFYALYLFVSTGVLRRYSPPPLSRLLRVIERGLLPRRAA